MFLLIVSYENTELLFQWKKEKGNKEVAVQNELEIPQFILTDYWTNSTTANFTSGTINEKTRSNIIFKEQHLFFLKI